MGNLYISAYGRSNVGKKRGNNEDNFYLSGITVDSATDITSSAPEVSELGFAVFDGMGGEAAGERASQYTADTYAQKLQEMIDGDFSPEVVQNTIEEANKRVCDEIRVIGKRMGCTFVSVGFKNDNLYISNVGDSRAYILRNGTLHCVSKDHTAAQTMVDAGLVSYEDSQKIKEKHQLTQHIGIFPEEMVIEPNYNSLKANSGDIVMICSDGLTDMLSDADIAAILSNGGTEQELTNALVERALENGGKDNVTVIVGKVSGEDVALPMAVPFMKKPDKKLYAIIGGAIALVILAVVIVLFATGKKDEKKDDKKDSAKKTVVSETDSQNTTDDIDLDDIINEDDKETNPDKETDDKETDSDKNVTDTSANDENDENKTTEADTEAVEDAWNGPDTADKDDKEDLGSSQRPLVTVENEDDKSVFDKIRN